MSTAVEKYGNLTSGGKVTLSLTQEEACAALLLYDLHIVVENHEDDLAIRRLLFKLKNEIWP